MEAVQLHEDGFLMIFWDEKARITSIDWKDFTASMTGDQFREKLTLFAGYVEEKRAGGILVDVSKFHHRPDPEFMPWHVKNISTRYTAAGVKCEAFVLNIKCKLLAMSGGFTGTISQALPPGVLFPIKH